MNGNFLTAYIVVLACFATLTKSDCFSNQTLTNLGFKNFTLPTNFTNATICRNAFNQFGACVTADNVESFLKNVHSTLKSRIDDGSSFTAVFDNIKGNIGSIFNKNNSQAIDTVLEDIKTKGLQNRDSCLKAIAYAQDGAYCLLASKAATNFATETLGSINLKVDLNDVGASLENCLPLINVVCTSVYGNPISNNDIYNSTQNATNIAFSNATCTNLKAFANCNSTACTQSVRTILVNEIFSTRDITFALPKTMLDKISEFYKKTIDSIKNLFSKRLQTTLTEVRLVADVSGRAIIADGKTSGVEAPSANFAQIAFAGLVSVLALLFA